MPQLVFRYDDGGEEVLPLGQDVVSVGRYTDNAVVIDHDYISGHHARFHREGDGGYRLFDLSSNNGTYVNDRLISETKLQHGDTIRFGVFEVAYLDVPSPAPSPAPEPAPPAGGQESDPELIRMEARRVELQILLVQEHRKFEELKDKLVPEMQATLAALHREIEHFRTQRQSGQAEQEELQGRLGELREATDSVQRDYDLRRAALTATVNDLLAAESARDEVRKEFETLRAAQSSAESVIAQVRQEHDHLVSKNKAIVAAVHDAEQSMATLRQQIQSESASREDLERENEELRQKAAQTRDRLQMAEARVLGKIRDWNEFESNQLTQIVERKAKLDDQCAAAEARLSKARDELADMRERMRSETDGSSAALHELRINHYEPTRELHEELTLRNEELANEIARKEQRLRHLEKAIQESRETEQIVSTSLEKKGHALENLEQRIGEEYSRIAASIISLHRPVAAQKPPRLADLAEIFVPSSGPPPLVPANRPGSRPGPPRTCLAVFDPNSQARSVDFTQQLELEVDDTPLPVGFMGLAAATRGSFSTSLARTVETNRPVLLVTGEELQETHGQLKKLRAALPSQSILLGWKASTFVKVTESLHQGTNFQDLLAMLAISDGSLTTDPYMNTFFESLNQEKRFLYLPPALPWNSKPRPPMANRTGIYVDITAFQPDDPGVDAFLADLKSIVESTRQLLTIPEVSRARARRLQERLELGPDWTRVIPVPEYKELVGLLGKHLAVACFEETGFDHPMLRDSLLAGTMLLSPPCEAYQTFFPTLSSAARGQKFADAALVARLFDSPQEYEDLLQSAEKTLLESHSYQAAGRQLDAFMTTLRR